MSGELAIGVDVGGTKIAFALVNRVGDVLATHRLPTLPAEGADAVCDRIAQGVHHLLEQATAPVVGVGIGSPGHLNPHTGVVYNAVNLAWDAVALRSNVQARLNHPLPIWVIKDANAGALGELYFGAARGCTDFVYITLGTGLGGGAIVNGELALGGTFAAMEIGHMPFVPQATRPCACSMVGCPEMYLSGIGMLAGVREHLPQYPQSSLAALGDDLTTTAVLDAARMGDALALAVIAEMGDWLCSLLIALSGVFNPQMFVIGGGLGHAAAELIVPVAQKRLRERAAISLYRIPIHEAQVTSSAVGAASRVWAALPPPTGETHE